MGRKGIGKLALFSIANCVTVYTSCENERHAFEMRTDDIRKAIEAEETYYPKPVDYSGPTRGTRIVLEDLKKRRTGKAINALRKRIARRFSIIGYSALSGDSFDVVINKEKVGSQDRDDLQAVEFLWEFGEERINEEDCPNLVKRFTLPNIVEPDHEDWKVRGWLGAADQPKRLRADEGGSLNGIVVLARGRLIQENILDKLNFSRVLVSYLTGHVEADFLDIPGEEDIATSDRQRLVEDDERYLALSGFLRNSLLKIQDTWTDVRNEARGREAVSEIPALHDWIGSLPSSQRKNAKKLLGLIRGVELDDEDERIDLYKSGMIAFERLRLREEAHLLGQGEALTATKLLPLLSDLSTLEGSLYREIVKVRLDVIREFESLVDENEKEKVLQKHLFTNLWLLDAGWERATGSERVEQTLRRDYKEFSEDLTEDQSKGRIDIRYRTNAGEHIVVELKRARRRLHLAEMVEQGGKYFAALQNVLSAQGIADPYVSVVFVVGQPLFEETDADGPRRIRETLKASCNGRCVHYEELIATAQRQYREFLDRTADADRLDGILRRIGGE